MGDDVSCIGGGCYDTVCCERVQHSLVYTLKSNVTMRAAASIMSIRYRECLGHCKIRRWIRSSVL
jgi:hypothetical protein